jgi:hypothetical protein
MTLRELRFTRSGQATTFAAVAGVGLALSFGLWSMAQPGHLVPALLPAYWALLPLIISVAALWEAWRLTRFAFLTFSSIGVEIYPYLRAESESQLVPWATIGSITLDEATQRLVITRTPEAGEGKIFITLAPLSRTSRRLLSHAVAGLQKQFTPADEPKA